MRKSTILPTQDIPPTASPEQEDWLDVENLAQVEVTSEHEDHPIESALISDGGPGWRAGQPGKQTIRLVFDEPQVIRRIHLLFQETEQERTQEFLLRWLRSGEQSYREIVRQQYSFSPPDTVEEAEDYAVDLAAVAALELIIEPDLSGKEGRAMLTRLRLA